MKAMILAAGLGTRLKPITDKIPKALVEVGGIPMLERVLMTLKLQGFDDITVNVHHFAGMIKDFLGSRDFGVKIKISDESEELLDTGGGIVKASSLLFGDDENPVLIHNVDIISNADLGQVMSGDGTTLLVSDRESSRKLIFDKEMNLRGWHDLRNDRYRGESLEGESERNEYAFSGIYKITKQAAEEMRGLMGEGKYSVMDYFLHPERKENIKGYLDKTLRLIDIGKPATLSQASDML